jgi:hypothetical protein
MFDSEELKGEELILVDEVDEEWNTFEVIVEHVRTYRVRVDVPRSWKFDEINGMAAAKSEHGHNGDDVKDLGRVIRVVKTTSRIK